MQHFIPEQTQKKIKTFTAQSLTAFHKTYKGWLIQYRNQESLWDTIKIGIGFSIFLLFFFTYLYFINIASTAGYFLKTAQEELKSTHAKSDIIKLEVVNEKKENRNKLNIPQKETKNNLVSITIPLSTGENNAPQI